MPIRLCQKCGLKVLIEPNQADVNPFLCHRCVAAEKAADGSGGPPPDPAPIVADPAPAPPAEEPAPPPIAGGGKGGPVKVLCPYCKASFSGRLPTRPAKGACPICQKDLVLLPDGKIRPAATFDLTKWQKEQEQSKFGGDPGVAEQARAAQKALDQAGDVGAPAPLELPPDVSPAEEQAVPMPKPFNEGAEQTLVSPQLPGSDPFAGLHSETMLDMGRPDLEGMGGSLRRPPAPLIPPVMAQPEPPAPEGDGDGATVKAEEPPAPEPEPPPPEPQEAEAPQPVEPPAAEAPAAAPPTKGATSKIEAPSRSNPVKVAIGVVLLLLPLAVGGVCFALPKNKELNGLVDKIGAIACKGLIELHNQLVPKPPPPRPKKVEQTPTRPPEPPTVDLEAKRKAMEEEMDKEWSIAVAALHESRKYPGATGEQAKHVERQKQKYKESMARFELLQKEHRKLFGKDYKPNEK